MKKRKSWYKKWWMWIIIVLATLLLIFGIPLVINICYIGNEGYITVWGGADVLQYYGAILSFLGTVLLGALALWQNYILARQNDGYRKILELKDLPVLEIRFLGFTRNLYDDPKIIVANITSNIATNFEVLKCGVRTSEKDKYFYEYSISETYQNHFKGNDEIKIEFRECEKNLTTESEFLMFEVIFHYTDIYGRVHEKRARKNLKEGNWHTPMEIEK